MSGSLPSPDDVDALIRARRTSMLVDRERQVEPELVTELCELATWAPNHKKTWPWRFAYFTGDGRRRFGETMVADMTDADFGDEGKRAKTATKYLRTPGTLVVGCAPHENAMLHTENRDAVAAGIQNILIGATARGLATFWSTPALTSPTRTLDLCGFGADDRIVAVIYLGWPTGEPAAQERPRPHLERITD
jgi:nitroreductase